MSVQITDYYYFLQVNCLPVEQELGYVGTISLEYEKYERTDNRLLLFSAG